MIRGAARANYYSVQRKATGEAAVPRIRAIGVGAADKRKHEAG